MKGFGFEVLVVIMKIADIPGVLVAFISRARGRLPTTF
jgi:hypothetical protein